MKDRLLKFLNSEQLSSARFAEIIGVQPSSVSHILSGRNNPGFEFIQKILTHYPNLNADWLIIGKGNMFKQDNARSDLFTENSARELKNTDNEKLFEKTRGQAPETEPGINTKSDERRNMKDEVTDVNNTDKHPDYKSESSKGMEVTGVTSGKAIVKVIVLYSDKSFSEYSPEK